MDEKKTVWDPLRKKEVAFTPEEQVRQWCIAVLSSKILVPMHMMMSEVGFRLGDKQFRADILVYDRNARPMLIVECKRPDIELSRDVLEQAVRYNMALNVRYLMITNGTKTFICRRKGDSFEFINDVPTYEEMLCQQL